MLNTAKISSVFILMGLGVLSAIATSIFSPILAVKLALTVQTEAHNCGLGNYFSFDSLLTAIVLPNNITTGLIAVVFLALIINIFATPMGNFVNEHFFIKILHLPYLRLIGTLLAREIFRKNRHMLP